MPPPLRNDTTSTAKNFSSDKEIYEASLDRRAKVYLARNLNSHWSASKIASRMYETGNWEEARARSEGPDDSEAIIRILRWIDYGSGATSGQLQRPFADNLNDVDIDYAAEPPARDDSLVCGSQRIDSAHDSSLWETNLKGPSPAPQPYPSNNKIGNNSVVVDRRGPSSGFRVLPCQVSNNHEVKDPRKVNWRAQPSGHVTPPRHLSTTNNVQDSMTADRTGPANGSSALQDRPPTKYIRKDPRNSDRWESKENHKDLKNAEWRESSQHLPETKKIERILKRGETMEGDEIVNPNMETSPEGIVHAKPLLKKGHSSDTEKMFEP
jgi:hypothetical protein